MSPADVNSELWCVLSRDNSRELQFLLALSHAKSLKGLTETSDVTAPDGELTASSKKVLHRQRVELRPSPLTTPRTPAGARAQFRGSRQHTRVAQTSTVVRVRREPFLVTCTISTNRIVSARSPPRNRARHFSRCASVGRRPETDHPRRILRAVTKFPALRGISGPVYEESRRGEFPRRAWPVMRRRTGEDGRAARRPSPASCICGAFD